MVLRDAITLSPEFITLCDMLVEVGTTKEGEAHEPPEMDP
jgi:ribosome-associated protein YbcJ (S4-like RNA binding protein)